MQMHTHSGVLRRHTSDRQGRGVLWQKGGNMATAVITWNTWNVEYYETMAAAERARQKVAEAQSMRLPMGMLVFAEAILWYPFRRVTHDTEKLVSLLEKLESYPSSDVLQEDADKMPESLRELFRKMCEVLQKTESLGLSERKLLRDYFRRMGELSQTINDFAERYEDAHKKLQARVSPQEALHYREAYEAYWNTELKSDQATEDDVKDTVPRH